MLNNPYELLYMFRQGNDAALQDLLVMYQPMVQGIIQQLIKKMRRLNIYEEDMMQEGLIVIGKTVDLYRDDQNCSFSSFIYMCIHRRLCSVLRYYSSNKNPQPHNCIPLSQFVSESGMTYEFIPNKDPLNEPEFFWQYQDAYERIQNRYEHLNEKEKEVFELWLEDETYQRASERLNISYKAYDNRLQRLRKSFKEALNS